MNQRQAMLALRGSRTSNGDGFGASSGELTMACAVVGMSA